MNASYRWADGLLTRDSGPVTLVLPRGQDQVTDLRGTARDIWELFAAGSTTEAVVEALDVRYDVSRELITAEVATVVAELCAAGLLVEVLEP